MDNKQDDDETVNVDNYLTTAAMGKDSIELSNGVGELYVDETGRYFYQNADGTQHTIVVVSDQDEVALNGAEPDEPEKKKKHASGDSLQVINGVSGSNMDNQVILNTGDTSQIVTIVPSSSSNGEVSYVFIVEQAEDGADGDDNVYDFNEADEVVDAESCDEDEKKVMRVVHRKSQSVTKAYMCNYCNYTSPKRYLLSRHLKSHSEERPHRCSVCERGFKTLVSLQNHVNTHTGVKPHCCRFCESNFTTSGELVRHVRYIHTHEKPHSCPECDYASVELSKLKRHMRCHTGERPYQCPHCTYASPDTFKLKRHLRIHTGEKPYECDVCGTRFTQSNSLKAHRLIHTPGIKPVYACELCPATCGRKTDLRIHIQKLHTSEKPLRCKKCNKSFPDRYTHKLHSKTHGGEKCYKCDLCAYASVSLRHLESHMLVHTERKPFACTLCVSEFRQKQLLKRHINLYHNPNYVPPLPREKNNGCPECGKAFRHKGNLIRHMAIHDPDSSVHEKVTAVRMERGHRYHVINGQQVEVFNGSIDDDDDDDDDDTILVGSNNDGDEYVMLEVIQLQDEDGHVVMTEELSVQEDSMEDSEDGHSQLLTSQDNFDSSLLTLQKRSLLKTNLVVEPKVEVNKEMDSCFGFDVDDDETGQLHFKFGD